jgi:DNA-binding SARP family transcriptional activator
MTSIEIRLLGGFEVRHDGTVVRNFESQKARALLAYLAMHAGQPMSRDHVSTLLWPDRDEQAARRNLRQVLYSLRTVFAATALPTHLLEAEGQTIGLNPKLDVWLDVADFESATEQSLGGEPDSQQLGRAARLYVGDFLSGFFVRDCPPFEDWLLATQERLREAALAAFHILVTSCLERGESQMGIHYARRLLAIDPLSERAHRQLIRLYAQSGRRTRALAQFEELRNLLNQELGVEPLAETTALYQTILLEELPTEAATEEPIGPLIPLAGRADALAQLQRSWQQALEDGGRLAFVRGEAGIGKTRLIKTFVDTASSQRKTRVVRGRAYEASAVIAFAPWGEVVTTVFADLMPDEGLDPRSIDPQVVSVLALLAPQLAGLDPELLGGRPLPEEADAARLPEALSVLLTILSSGAEGTATPVIVMLSDLHWADEESLDLLAALGPHLAALPILVVASIDPSTAGASHPVLGGGPQAPELPIDDLELGRLEAGSLSEIAAALVPASHASWLSEQLEEWSGGLPLAVTELINFFWDEGVLISSDSGGWTLDIERAKSCVPPADLSELIIQRFRGLPASARRLLALAAVTGQHFDVDLLRAAGDEHLAVVEACVELMLHRWLIRQFPRTWTHTGRERDIVLFARGARRGVFEFAHERIRTVILGDVNPLRAQVMHRDVAAALLDAHGSEPESVAETLAHHLLEGGELRQALEHLEAAAKRARHSGASSTERRNLERWVAALDRSPAGSATATAKKRVEARLRRLLAESRPEAS